MFYSGDISYYIISLGCSKNLVDSERINGEMISAGYKPADSAEEAGIIIINTCGFIKPAKEESIEIILDAASLKEDEGERFDLIEEDRFSRKLVVTGCLSKRYYDDMLNDMPEIDFLYGIPDDNFVRKFSESFKIRINDPLHKRKRLYTSPASSYIKISDGCSNNCSYCAIPLIRGPHVPFPPEFILEEASDAAAGGALELNIIAQDIAAYRWEEMRLPGLVNRISEIEGVKWIRLLYCHPDHITDDIIELISSNSKVVPYIDLPFQHVNPEILRSMGRMGSPSRYYDLVNRLREKVPGIIIRSTFMVGYPGEKEKQFQELLGFIKKARLDKVGCFTYSSEEDTKASFLRDTISPKVKERRASELMSIQMEISSEKMSSYIGTEVDVLVEDKIDDKTYVGRTKYDAPEVDGVFYLTSGENRVNDIVRARVTDSVEYDLIGEII
ncbi:MAG TPA: 30S ribosomal protein S12 methylthiotransferase RimO [Spirochaetota bacterium]|nr:30S ribosomal protein S12 methylthiotransferase RimO [Spirochaetota bacterium]HPJ34733.1 30S ribosomal protein S12 methylthiotransferase RimO [Spirochaetota bacterium]